MSFEVERKFLVSWALSRVLAANPPVRTLLIEQRYLRSTGDWTIRIRKTVCDTARYHLTMKQRVSDMRAVELETEISDVFYASMAHRCGTPILKTRYEVMVHDHLWEIDQFSNPKLDKLVLAEIELDNEETTFQLPEWIGAEVTNDKNYKNNRLAKKID